ncbi:UBX domain-containing protein 6 isoform X2 [Hyla sarda]|uniref:UBX domain-containing protein 6 isoform X2 n=1 Tax=Hyla sarda TaxID=327740 RepID=UPI0024C3F69E|nr:UBX domain-containing protein 6 isoform X2 [Hyla sarda]
MKKLFEGLKADIKFRSAGTGRRLIDEARELPDNAIKERPPPRKEPPGDAQIAAASAAIARLDSKQGKGKGKTPLRDNVHTQAQDVAVTQEVKVVSNNKKTETENHSLYNIMFRCPLTGEILRKEDIEAHVKKSIEMLSTADPISASIMKIHTFNKDKDKVKLGVETMAKYLRNIIANPYEEKYQKVKLTNKVFQEKVICLEGAHDFFEAVGFEKKSLTLQGQELQEEFYVLSSDALDQLKNLQSYHDSLVSGEPLIATLDRQPQIFIPSDQAANFDLPDEFFNLTIEEVRLDQKLRTENLKQNSMLKTKAMWEREEKREIRKYKYTVLRIRFPDDYILQGLFYAQERLSVLVDFIRQHLQNDWLPFKLIAPCGQKLEDEQATFSQCGLVWSVFNIT